MRLINIKIPFLISRQKMGNNGFLNLIDINFLDFLPAQSWKSKPWGSKPDPRGTKCDWNKASHVKGAKICGLLFRDDKKGNEPKPYGRERRNRWCLNVGHSFLTLD